jgi:hypothetical protein
VRGIARAGNQEEDVMDRTSNLGKDLARCSAWPRSTEALYYPAMRRAAKRGARGTPIKPGIVILATRVS